LGVRARVIDGRLACAPGRARGARSPARARCRSLERFGMGASAPGLERHAVRGGCSMSGETKVQCPIWGRIVGFLPGATNLAGEPVMRWHWRADIHGWERCEGSSRSPRAAAPEPAPSQGPNLADYDPTLAAELRALRAKGNAERRAARLAKRT